MDERDLTQMVRAGLGARAEETDTRVPVLERVHADVGRRRRTRWSVVAAAASVAAIAGGASIVALGDDEGQRQVDVPPAADSQDLPADGTWRTEYWADIAVDVPAEWGYGGAPDASGTACYPEAIIGPDGRHVDGGKGLGYVGRPIASTDVCALVPQTWEPAAPYVWLGAGIEPGIYEYANGYVQETVEVNGSAVTVGTTDAGVRERILDSARVVELVVSDEGNRLCPVRFAHVVLGRNGEAEEGRGALMEGSVCVYGAAADDGFALTYAEELTVEQLEATFAAIEQAPISEVDCDYEPTEFVVIRGWYDDPLGAEGAMAERVAVFETGCEGSISDGGRAARQVTREAVEPWTRNGVPAVVYGPRTARPLHEYFIGPQG